MAASKIFIIFSIVFRLNIQLIVQIGIECIFQSIHLPVPYTSYSREVPVVTMVVLVHLCTSKDGAEDDTVNVIITKNVVVSFAQSVYVND